MSGQDDGGLKPPKVPRVLPRRGSTLTRAMVCVYVAIGADLLLQPERFSLTPAYHNLIVFLSAKGWGAIYLACALVLVVWLSRGAPRGRLVILAHLPAVALGAWWDMSFLVRFLTDIHTTVVNVVSWALYVFLLLRSAYLSNLHGEGTS